MSYFKINCPQTLPGSVIEIPKLTYHMMPQNHYWGSQIFRILPPSYILDNGYPLNCPCILMWTLLTFNLVYFSPMRATLIIYTYSSTFLIQFCKLLEKGAKQTLRARGVHILYIFYNFYNFLYFIVFKLQSPCCILHPQAYLSYVQKFIPLDHLHPFCLPTHLRFWQSVLCI